MERVRTITLTIGLPGAGQEAWLASATRAGAVVIDRGALRRFLAGVGGAGTADRPDAAATPPRSGLEAADAALFRELVAYHLRRSEGDVVIHDLHVFKRDRVHMIQTIRCSDTSPRYQVIGALFTAPLALCAERLAHAGTHAASGTLAAYAQALAAHDPRREGGFDRVVEIAP